MKKWLIIFICLISINTFAQNSTDKRVTVFLEKAEIALQKNLYVDAQLHLENVIAIDPKSVKAHQLLGNTFFSQKRYKEAAAAYYNAVQSSSNLDEEVYYFLAQSQFATADYNNAKVNFNKFISIASNTERIKHSKKFIIDCEFAVEAIKTPVKYSPQNLGSRINTYNSEYFPSITADGETIIYTRVTAGNEDFWTANYKNNNWQTAIPLSSAINTTQYNEGAQSITPDGKYLFFTGCNRPNGLGRCDIYVSSRSSNTWEAPENLGAPINTEYWESQPAISPDGNTLYFVSNRPGGYGGYDIWKSTINKIGEWAKPVNLGPNINTPFDETTPFIHADGKTLYFSSNGWPGFGNNDIFFSQLNKNGAWDKAKNIGYPINSFEDENGLVVSADGNTGFFSSNVKDGFGMQDIYQFSLPDNIKPKKVTYVKGSVYDNDDKKTIEANVQVVDLKTNTVVYDDYTDPYNGKFLAVMPVGSSYLFNVNADGYTFYSDNFELNDEHANKPYELEVIIEKIRAGSFVTLNNIFFDTDKFNLLPQSIRELDFLISFLNQNPNIHIEIQGHTDNKGNDQINEKLSLNRAQAVYKYLQNSNINTSRLTFKGFGSKKPVADNNSEAGRKKNRRTNFIITKI